MKIRNVLIIDDEESLRHMLSILLKKEGYEVGSVESAEEGLHAIRQSRYDLVFCDVRMRGMDGFAFLGEIREVENTPSVVMMSAYGSIETAIQCMKMGAYDYISKPFNHDEVLLTIRKIEERHSLLSENLRLKREVGKTSGAEGFIARGSRMQTILDTADKVAEYKTTILITGESGTGKEVLARRIHENSGRDREHFVAVNCGAIPEELLESELFGHARGSFTGATHDKQGLFHEANNGTLFLDEVGELPASLQVKLLRALQEGEVRRVGSNKQEAVDVRVIAATNKDLHQAVENGAFREDLYYRLNVVHLHLPPLRERREDIATLAEVFLKRHLSKTGKDGLTFSSSAMRVLADYGWPGNVRELENCVERAVVLASGDSIDPTDLPQQLLKQAADRPLWDENELSIKKATHIMERALILRALERTGGNRTHAAKLLEISHRALLYKLKAYGIPNKREQAEAARDGEEPQTV